MSENTQRPPEKPPVPEWRLRLALLVVSLLVPLLLAEIAVRILGLGKPQQRDGEQQFSFFTRDPQLGWDLVPGTEDRLQTDEFDITIRITEQGLRAPRLYPATKAPGTQRTVVLGDSFTFGHGVEAEQAWPALVERALEPRSGTSAEPSLDGDVAEQEDDGQTADGQTADGQEIVDGDQEDDRSHEVDLAAAELINLAVTGYGTDQQLLRFEQRGPDLQPDRVLLGLFVGNVFRNARDFQLAYPKPRFRLRSGELQLTGVPILQDRVPEAPLSRLWFLSSSLLGNLGAHLGGGGSWPVTEAILQRLQQQCLDLGAELSVLVLPKDQMIYGQGWRLRLHERSHQLTHRMLERLGIPYLDLTTALRQAAPDSDERLYFPVDGHWTVAGHRVAAEAVLAWQATSSAMAPLNAAGQP